MTRSATGTARDWRPDWPCDPYEVLRPIRRGAHDPAFQRDPDGTIWRATVTPDNQRRPEFIMRPVMPVRHAYRVQDPQ